MLSSPSLVCCETKENTLILRARPGSMLEFMYYGSILGNVSVLLDSAASLGPALAVYGPGSRMELGLRVTHADGNQSTVLHVYDIEMGNSSAAIVHHRVFLRDPAYPLTVVMHYRCYREEDIIEQWAEIKNEGKFLLTMHECPSFFLPIRAANFFLTHFPGGWGREMQLSENALVEGMTTLSSSCVGTAATMNASPSFMLSLGQPAQEEYGEVLAATLRWSGNWRLVFVRQGPNVLYISGGINPFASSYQLAAGETFNVPAMLMSYSNAGKGVISRRFHRWARNHCLQHGNKLRPIVQNSWEGTGFDFDEKKILSYIDFAAEMGVELFVLDDGWFGQEYQRNDDASGLGDWQVNRAKLPGGLSALAEYARKKSLKFGIWIEPEMVNPRSRLYGQHPEWVLRLPNRQPFLQRNQLVLDLSNPLVQEYILEVFDNLLRSGDIAYIKWDCNSYINNPGSTFLDSSRQEEIWIRYVRGLERVLERLRAAYPNVLIQACSSGGGRVEYGSLTVLDEFWASDNTDAKDRVIIQWGYSHFFPAIAIGAHVSASPNFFTGRSAPLKFRVDVAMAGRFGIELPPLCLNPEEVAFLKNAVEQYKAIRDIVQFGDLFRLVSPLSCGMASLMYVTDDRARAVLFAYMLEKSIQQQFPPIRLVGLDSKAYYQVEEINLPAGVEQTERVWKCTGEFLMLVGIPVVGSSGQGMNIPLRREMDSAVFVLTRI